MNETKAAEIMDDAWNLWDNTDDTDVSQADVNRTLELLDLSYGCFERQDWTGAWLWAGNAIGFIRERVAPLPATA